MRQQIADLSLVLLLATLLSGPCEARDYANLDTEVKKVRALAYLRYDRDWTRSWIGTVEADGRSWDFCRVFAKEGTESCSRDSRRCSPYFLAPIRPMIHNTLMQEGGAGVCQFHERGPGLCPLYGCMPLPEGWEEEIRSAIAWAVDDPPIDRDAIELLRTTHNRALRVFLHRRLLEGSLSGVGVLHSELIAKSEGSELAAHVVLMLARRRGDVEVPRFLVDLIRPATVDRLGWVYLGVLAARYDGGELIRPFLLARLSDLGRAAEVSPLWPTWRLLFVDPARYDSPHRSPFPDRPLPRSPAPAAELTLEHRLWNVRDLATLDYAEVLEHPERWQIGPTSGAVDTTGPTCPVDPQGECRTSSIRLMRPYEISSATQLYDLGGLGLCASFYPTRVCRILPDGWRQAVRETFGWVREHRDPADAPIRLLRKTDNPALRVLILGRLLRAREEVDPEVVREVLGKAAGDELSAHAYNISLARLHAVTAVLKMEIEHADAERFEALALGAISQHSAITRRLEREGARSHPGLSRIIAEYSPPRQPRLDGATVPLVLRGEEAARVRALKEWLHRISDSPATTWWIGSVANTPGDAGVNRTTTNQTFRSLIPSPSYPQTLEISVSRTTPGVSYGYGTIPRTSPIRFGQTGPWLADGTWLCSFTDPALSESDRNACYSVPEHLGASLTEALRHALENDDPHGFVPERISDASDPGVRMFRHGRYLARLTYRYGSHLAMSRPPALDITLLRDVRTRAEGYELAVVTAQLADAVAVPGGAPMSLLAEALEENSPERRRWVWLGVCASMNAMASSSIRGLVAARFSRVAGGGLPADLADSIRTLLESELGKTREE